MIICFPITPKDPIIHFGKYRRLNALKLMRKRIGIAQKTLCELVKEQWQAALKKVIGKAIQISEKEEKQGGKHKVVFGV